MNEPKADILVVDDTPAFLEVLRTMLQEQGYRVRPVPNGRIALAAVEQQPPELILLDIEMPELNGFETCERLRADERFRDIPVIFLSALTATDDKVRAFGAGGVDYVTKPFQAEEVIARVETHLRIRRLQQRLAAQYQDLKRLESLRDSLTHMIVHDLRSPLQGIMASLQLLETDADRLGGTAPDVLRRGLRSARTMIQMISTLLDVNRMEAGEMPLHRSDGDLNGVVSQALESLAGLVDGRPVATESDGPVTASFDRDIMVRVVANLVANALKFTPAEARVTVRTSRRRGGATVEVIDRGPGIPPEYRERIFQKFGQVDAPQGRKPLSTGLGLAFCRLALDAHGGDIGVDSVVGEGSTFWFVLR
jgi:signal transduction histidine kinase